MTRDPIERYHAHLHVLLRDRATRHGLSFRNGTPLADVEAAIRAAEQQAEAARRARVAAALRAARTSTSTRTT